MQAPCSTWKTSAIYPSRARSSNRRFAYSQEHESVCWQTLPTKKHTQTTTTTTWRKCSQLLCILVHQLAIGRFEVDAELHVVCFCKLRACAGFKTTKHNYPRKTHQSNCFQPILSHENSATGHVRNCMFMPKGDQSCQQVWTVANASRYMSARD